MKTRFLYINVCNMIYIYVYIYNSHITHKTNDYNDYHSLQKTITYNM